MLETRKNKGKGKEVEMVVCIPSQVRQWNEAQDESPSHTSPPPPAPDEPESSEIPPEPPIDATM